MGWVGSIYSGTLSASNNHKPSLGLLLDLVPTQWAEAQKHYAPARADTVLIQQSLLEVTNKVTTLAIDLTELWQRVSDALEVGLAATKSFGMHDQQLAFTQAKVEDLENCYREPAQQFPGGIITAGAHDPNVQLLASNQESAVDDNGVFKGERNVTRRPAGGRELLPMSNGSHSVGVEEKMPELRGRRKQQPDELPKEPVE
ncbi:hypothetical protein NDU88_003318 [Pleurodeles waltl]|uniref:Uncharacterized protein n=1 Tax=Pleurodeles waltl TaxID=8319 RepID=A0AAV7L3L7_PLEWA|nr:hypothetical protein NDU88_003318 [Pleurodeles waltl]